MLLDHLGKKSAAQNIEAAVKSVTGAKLKSMAAGRMGYGTREVGDLVVAALR
jgi:3-isopropylmalate dehydrogenase